MAEQEPKRGPIEGLKNFITETPLVRGAKRVSRNVRMFFPKFPQKLNPHAELAEDLDLPPEAGPEVYLALLESAFDLPDEYWEKQLKKESKSLKEPNNPPPSLN